MGKGGEAASPHPERKTIDGRPAVRVDSNLVNWPGCIYVPAELSAEQFLRWWEKVQARKEAADLPRELLAYQERFHLVLEWHIEGLQPHMIDEDGRKLPSPTLWNLVTHATQQQLIDAQILPNSQRPSSVIASKAT